VQSLREIPDCLIIVVVLCSIPILVVIVFFFFFLSTGLGLRIVIEKKVTFLLAFSSERGKKRRSLLEIERESELLFFIKIWSFWIQDIVGFL